MKLDSLAAHRIVAGLLILIGLICMATVWLSFVIIGVSTRVHLVEMLVGVTFSLIGYLLWISQPKRYRMPSKRHLCRRANKTESR
jgi:uncharacterized Tic20 family protein